MWSPSLPPTTHGGSLDRLSKSTVVSSWDRRTSRFARSLAFLNHEALCPIHRDQRRSGYRLSRFVGNPHLGITSGLPVDYVLFFFLLRSVLARPSIPFWTSVTLSLTAVLLIANASWNWIFFRKRDPGPIARGTFDQLFH